MRSGLRAADATVISVLAYAGLRPGEALAVRWHHVRERTVLVESAISFGQEKVGLHHRPKPLSLDAPRPA
jgi:integrase